jgi:hypothetical protein
LEVLVSLDLDGMDLVVVVYHAACIWMSQTLISSALVHLSLIDNPATMKVSVSWYFYKW